LYQQANSYVGLGTIDELDANNQDCLTSGENNTVWYIINVASSGILVFTITPNAPTDYDFAVWNATGIGCAAVQAGPPIRCNYAGTQAATGLSITAVNPSENAGGPPFSSAINAVAGETYILVVDNFSSSQFGYSLDFSASTASIYDTIKPKFQAAGSLCGTVSNKVNVTMSEPVKCNSLAANGSDFYITPTVPGVSQVIAASSTNCVGTAQFTNGFTIQFAGTLPAGTYWLHAQQGSDNNSVIDNCSNEQVYTDSIQFTMTLGNPPQLIILDTPSCARGRVILDRAIDCGTVALNGSDFNISGPSAVGVISAIPVNCNAVGMTDTIDLIYDKSIFVPGTYTLHVKVGSDANSILDTCGVSVTNTISWEVSDAGVTATADPYLLCDPGYITLAASTTLFPSPAGYNYIWTPSQFLNDSTAATTLAYVNGNAVYQVQMIDQHLCYRRDTAAVTLSVRNPILEPVVDSTICIGDKLTFHSSGGLNYAWFPADGLSCTNCSDPVVTPTQTTQYFVVISDQYNCSDTLYQTLIVNPLPIVDAGEDRTIYFGDDVQLNTSLSPASLYLWQPSVGLNYITIPNPIANPGKTTTYSITVIDTNECQNSDTVTVFVRDDVPVFIPSGFSPNGDGRNDVFILSNIKFHRLQEFRIFNRWGQEVFSTTNPQTGWDGTFKGTAQESGVYNYLIKVSYPLGRVETYKGDVTLIR
jgi:gliding motility-associated-like protein